MKEKEVKEEWRKTNMAIHLSGLGACPLHPYTSGPMEWRAKTQPASQSSLPCCHFPTTHARWRIEGGLQRHWHGHFFFQSSLGYSALPPPWAQVLDQTVPSPQWSLWPSVLCDGEEGNLWLPRLQLHFVLFIYSPRIQEMTNVLFIIYFLKRSKMH